MADHFGEFYAGVNVEWPQYALSVADAALQERRWRGVLGHLPLGDLQHAMRRALASGKKRPTAAHFLEWAQEASVRHERRQERILPHWSKCQCGCGGLLWLKVLRDPNTNAIRHFPESLERMTNQLTSRIAANPDVAAKLAPLAGAPMTRFQCECRRRGGDALPAEVFYLGLENGVPVYDPMRRISLEDAA
jgi:hypothetical protein